MRIPIRTLGWIALALWCAGGLAEIVREAPGPRGWRIARTPAMDGVIGVPADPVTAEAIAPALRLIDRRPPEERYLVLLREDQINEQAYLITQLMIKRYPQLPPVARVGGPMPGGSIDGVVLGPGVDVAVPGMALLDSEAGYSLYRREQP